MIDIYLIGVPQKSRYRRRSSDETNFDLFKNLRSKGRRPYKASYEPNQREEYAEFKVGAVLASRERESSRKLLLQAVFLSLSLSDF